METLFFWTVPNIHNSLNYYKEYYGELKLFTYINEFEILFGSVIEKCINEDLSLPKIITTMKIVVKDIIEKIEFNWRNLKARLDEFDNTS